MLYSTWLVLVVWLGALLVPGGLTHLFSAETPYFDLEHYQFISTEGYDVLRTAFFPGFPLLLKALGGQLVLTSVVNILLVSASLAMLASYTRNAWERALLILQPVVCFWLIAYSEALFFFSITLAIRGLVSKQFWWLAMGLALAAFTRPLWAVLLPAFVWMYSVQKQEFGNIMLLGGMLGVTFGTVGAFAVQAVGVGKWATFFQAQKEWGNELAFPAFPLSTWSDATVMLLDCAGLTVGVCAGVLVLKASTRKQGRPSVWWMAMLYLAGICALVLCFRGGGLFSLNRFVFATPFFGLALLYAVRSAQESRKNYWWLAAPLVCIIACGGYLHIQAMVNLLPILLVAVLWLFSAWVPIPAMWRSVSRVALVLSAVLFQVLMWTRVLCAEWVG